MLAAFTLSTWHLLVRSLVWIPLSSEFPIASTCGLSPLLRSVDVAGNSVLLSWQLCLAVLTHGCWLGSSSCLWCCPFAPGFQFWGMWECSIHPRWICLCTGASCQQAPWVCWCMRLSWDFSCTSTRCNILLRSFVWWGCSACQQSAQIHQQFSKNIVATDCSRIDGMLHRCGV
jgi:hypothetical protein